MSHIVRFGSYEADLDSGQLFKRGVRIRLRHQAFQVLASLLENPRQVVTREELRHLLWRDNISVDFENNLNTAVAQLREALCDSADHPSFIETLPKRGYRFIADVYALPPANAESARARLIVLPFVNLSGDPSQESFCDAISDEIITVLAGVAPGKLGVIARTTAMHYKSSHKDVARIARELHVDYVVEGGIRRTGERYSINVQLIETSDQTHLFAHRYEVAQQEIADTQSRIAETIASHIPVVASRIRGGAIAGSAPRRISYDLRAYNEYIQGRTQLAKITPAGFARAKQHFETAIARDPEFAPGYDALAELCWYLGYFGMKSSREAFSAGIVHALRAIEIDTTRAETHALLGQFYKTIEYNWSEVHREMKLALDMDTYSPLVRMRYAISELMPHGRLKEAVEELELALDLDPLALFPRFWLGIVRLLSRDFERALEESRRMNELDPIYFPAYFVRAVACRYLGRCDDAIAAQQKAVELSGGAAPMLGWLGMILGSNHHVKDAREVLGRLYAMESKSYVPATSIAWVHLGLGEIDTSFQWLNRAVEECDQLMMPIKSYAFLDPIRSDPRFLALLQKMHLQ